MDMTSATVAVVAMADSLNEEELSELQPAPCAVWPGGAVVAFPTVTAAAHAMQRFVASRPFVRAALDVGEAPVDADGGLVISGMPAAARALDMASTARSGEVFVSEVGRLLLAASPDLRCEPCDRQAGTHRLVVPPPPVLLPLPKPLALASRHQFVNRYAPWLALERSWAAVTGGERRAILLEGEAGSGKTRLATEFARRVITAGGIAVYGGCSEAVELPFQPFNEALRPAFDMFARMLADGPAGRAWHDDLALLFPWASSNAGSVGRPAEHAGSAGLPGAPETDRRLGVRGGCRSAGRAERCGAGAGRARRHPLGPAADPAAARACAALGTARSSLRFGHGTRHHGRPYRGVR